MINNKNKTEKIIIIGALFAFISVGLGAFGAHSLKDILNDYYLRIWEKAVFYNMIHALAIIISGVLQKIYKESNFNFAAYSFIAGIILFSGSLYALALSQVKFFGILTPLGGVSFLLGWGLIIFYLSKGVKN